MMRPVVAVCVALALVSCVFGTALDDYVNAPDPNTKWVNMGHTYDWPHATGYLLNLTSQQWLTSADSTASIWWHYMVVVVPKANKFPDAALLWITGGSNHDGIPDQKSEDLIVTSNLVNATGTAAIALFQIPNEPITFAADPLHQSRSEDAIIAFTWEHFVNDTSQPEWLLRLPMTKACVAAMNATEQFLSQNNGLTITKWLAAGASKRGWTTWTLGAVEAGKRMVAIIPIVMDALNLIKNMHHMFRNLGGWTFAFEDYWNEGLTGQIDLPQMTELAGIVDPYSYLDRYAVLPKLVIDAGDDEFFQPDDNYLWWDNMTGEKHLLMVQNAEHSLVTGIPEVLHSVGAFVEGVLTGKPRPYFTWVMDLDNATITVNETLSPTKATKAVMHFAENLTDKRRDFRWITKPDDPSGKCVWPFIAIPKQEGMCLQPIIWREQVLERQPDGTYFATRPTPTNGKWEAFFITMHYESPLWEDYLFTTQIAITPNTIPFPDCYLETCKGTLV